MKVSDILGKNRLGVEEYGCNEDRESSVCVKDEEVLLCLLLLHMCILLKVLEIYPLYLKRKKTSFTPFLLATTLTII